MTTKFFFFLLLLGSITWAMQVQAVGIEIGTDRVVGEGATVLLHADINVEGLRDEEHTIKWYKRLYNQTDYEIMPFAEGATDVTLNPTETTYIKAIVNEAMGSNCYDEILVVVASVTVSEVSFIGTQADIRQDPTPTTPNPTYFTAPHWTDTEQKPVWYKAGDKITLSTKFGLVAPGSEQLTPITLMSDFVQNIRIKCSAGADVSNPTFLLPPISLTQSGNTLTSATNLQANTPFANQVGFYNPMSFKWEVSYTAGTDPYTTIVTTTNQVYVSNTVSSLNETERFHTTVHLSCKNATGLSNPQEIVDAIYTEFIDRDVRKLNGTQAMKYWGDPLLYAPTLENPVGLLSNTINLLIWQDGRCGSWMSLFVDMLRAQGIAKQEGATVGYKHISTKRTIDEGLNETSSTALVNAIQANPSWEGIPPYLLKSLRSPYNSDKARAFFHVKEWDLNSNSVGKFHYCTDAAGDGNTDNNGFNDEVRDGSTNVLAPGVAAQNNTDPYSYFSDHSIVRYNGKYYDPSYGSTPFNSFADWQAASIEGFSAMVCFLDVAGEPYNINSKDKYIWLEKLNDEPMYEFEESTP